MPQSFDIEHEEVNMLLAGEDKLGIAGLNLIYANDHRVHFQLNDNFEGKSADLVSKNGLGSVKGSVHLSKTQTGNELKVYSNSKNGSGLPDESQEVTTQTRQAKSIEDALVRDKRGQIEHRTAFSVPKRITGPEQRE